MHFAHLAFPLALLRDSIGGAQVFHVSLLVFGGRREGRGQRFLDGGGSSAFWDSSEKTEVNLHHQISEPALRSRRHMVTSPEWD